MDEWEYLMWRAILAGWHVTNDLCSVVFDKDGETSPEFDKSDQYIEAMDWLIAQDVNLPGLTTL